MSYNPRSALTQQNEAASSKASEGQAQTGCVEGLVSEAFGANRLDSVHHSGC
jgi:hypothetical protein